jgi:predicted outer membrane protein
MLRRVPRALRHAVIVAVLLAVGASIAQSWMSATPGTGGYVQTEWGPLGPADRDLLIKVRLAGLWEGPTGQQAEQQASRAEVQQVGTNVHNEHAELDRIVREAADQLGVLVPSRPTAEQLSWMNEMSGLTGTEYDRVFVQRLREAHGTVLPLIAQVRVGTRNELVREFAVTANEYVTRHIGYLESTGLVDYGDLPEPPSPGLLSSARGPIDLVVPALVVVAALVAAWALFSALRRRGAPGPAAPDRAYLSRPVDSTARAIAAIAVPSPRDPHPSGPHRIRTPTTSHSADTRITDTGPRHAVRR